MFPNKNRRNAVPTGIDIVADALSKQPLSNCVAAIDQLRITDPAISADYDGGTGLVRFLATDTPTGLSNLRYTGNPLGHAKKFLSTKSIATAFGLDKASLAAGTVDSFAFGNRVSFRQVINLKDGTVVPVRHGSVHTFLKGDGSVVHVASSIKQADEVPTALPKSMISQNAAIKRAQVKFGRKRCNSKVELQFSDNRGKFNAVYEVRLWAPRKARLYLVMATTGRIVHEQDLIHTSITSPAQQAGLTRIAAKGFLRIPDPKSPEKQVADHFIEALPDPKVLKNQRFTMLVREGGRWVEVKAKADGTFNYDMTVKAERSKFSAVATFIALNEQMAFYETLGLKKQAKPIPVYIDDPSVRDNAYFDPQGYEIHMGVGSGIPMGLAKDIAFDLGVEWHENGHHVVMLQTPGEDLPGGEGGAMHESTGDVLGQLVMDYLWGARYGKQLGAELTLDAIKKDRRVIGRYALPPDGIRIQRNNKRTPDDKTGEVHDDGLISGGAHADLLEAMIVKVVGEGKSITDGVTDFTKLYLASLALVPANRVLFKDMLRAMLSADQTLFSGKYKSEIEAAHTAHGITQTKATPGAGATPRTRKRKPRRG